MFAAYPYLRYAEPAGIAIAAVTNFNPTGCCLTGFWICSASDNRGIKYGRLAPVRGNSAEKLCPCSRCVIPEFERKRIRRACPVVSIPRVGSARHIYYGQEPESYACARNDETMFYIHIAPYIPYVRRFCIKGVIYLAIDGPNSQEVDTLGLKIILPAV